MMPLTLQAPMAASTPAAFISATGVVNPMENALASESTAMPEAVSNAPANGASRAFRKAPVSELFRQTRLGNTAHNTIAEHASPAMVNADAVVASFGKKYPNTLA